MDYRSDAFRQRRPMLKHARGLFCLAVVVAIPLAAGISQTINGSSGNATHDYSGIPPMNLSSNPVPDANRFLESSMRIKENQKRMDALNLQRQKDLTQETKELVVLAIHLKAETDQTSKDNVTVVELRQAELIEKLAKNVGERMKETVTH